MKPSTVTKKPFWQRSVITLQFTLTPIQKKKKIEIQFKNWTGVSFSCFFLFCFVWQLRDLKSKLQDDKSEINHPIKEETETFPSESENKISEEQSKFSVMGAIEGSENTTDQNKLDHFNGGLFGDFKDGSSDSDSSAILNDDNSPNRATSSEAFVPSSVIYPPPSSALRCNHPSSYNSSMSCLQFSDTRASVNAQKAYHQFLRMDESSFLNAEEACDFFSEEQAPTLSWYTSEPWSWSREGWGERERRKIK